MLVGDDDVDDDEQNIIIGFSYNFCDLAMKY